MVLRPSQLICITSLVLICSPVCQAQPASKTGTASIAGRITIAEKGVPDIVVVAATTKNFDNRTVSQATTDEDGNYRLNGLPTGSLRVFPLAKAYALPGDVSSRTQSAQSINLSEGEAVTDVDFKLVRGGVITGRVTDSEGQPIIAEEVVVTKTDAQEFPSAMFDGSRNRTDDRGIYRVYGLVAGSYKVSVGQQTQEGGGPVMSRTGNQYVKTFYPGVVEAAKAAIVEVKEGGEVSKIDFSVGKPPAGFAVSGRVVDAITGEAVPHIMIGYSLVDKKSAGGGANFVPNPTDANGRFRIEGLQPGRYGAFTFGIPRLGQSNSTYSDLAPFEITDADVTGIEVKLKRGATLQGIAVIENNADPAVIATLQNLHLYAFSERPESGGLGAPSMDQTRVLADGSFSFSGMAPGKVRIGISQYPAAPKGLNLARIEINGVVHETIEVAAGEQVTNVRLVFNYGSGSLRGQVKIEGGVLPEGSRLWVSVTQPGDSPRRYVRYAEVDARGKFFAEDVPPGSYELTTRVAQVSRDLPEIPASTRMVTITDGVETEVTLVLNLSTRKE